MFLNLKFALMLSRLFKYLVLILPVLVSVNRDLSAQEVVNEEDTLIYVIGMERDNSTYFLNYSLMTAASEGKVAGVRWNLKKGADVNCKNAADITPLHFAVANNNKLCAEELIKYHANVNSFSAYSETPLLIAVKNQNLEITEMLIRDSAQLELADRYGATALHYASAYGYFYVVDLLLYYEAPTYLKDKDGTTPLMAAVWGGHADVADLLLQNGADPEEKDDLGYSPFLIAAQNGDTVIMELLLKRHVDPFQKNNYNYNAIDICTRYNHVAAVKYLLRKSDKWNSKLNGSISPVTIAVVYHRKEIEKILLANGFTNSYNFNFEHVSFTASYRASFHDYFTGLNMSVREPRVKGGVFLALDFKPFYSRVLVKKSPELYYQYMDKSNVAYIGIFKDFSLSDIPAKGNWYFTTTVAGAYSFGNKLKGTDISFDKKMAVVPGAGFKWNKNSFELSFIAEYQKTPYHKVGPFWLRIGASYNLRLNSYTNPGKIIKWY
ncbi:MAG: ankyrin repeat domain-containing protein [Bacteroidales bacterium]